GGTGGHNARLRTSQLRQAASNRTLEIEHIHKIFGSFELSLADFRKLQRAAEIGPGAPAIDDGFHPQPGINILLRSLSHHRAGVSVHVASGNLAQQRSRRHQFDERTPARTISSHDRLPSRESCAVYPTNQALRGLTQKFPLANHFLSFYIEFFPFVAGADGI